MHAIPTHAPAVRDPWHVTDADGRAWKIMADSSLSAPKYLRALAPNSDLKMGARPDENG